jgi:cysteine desulfurase
MKERIYLDFNASAPSKPEVIEVVHAAMVAGGNASSVHTRGREAHKAVDDARANVAKLINCRPDEVIFTSCGTESNNFALMGANVTAIAISAIEHDSTLAAAQASGKPWLSLPVDGDGLVKLDVLDDILDKTQPPFLISVMLANNETGVLQPIIEIAEKVHRRGGLLHCDAIQAAGKVPVDFAALGADMLSLSAHKLAGPQGVGALIVRKGLEMQPHMVGGGQEMRRRSGTENVPGIVGFGRAAELAHEDVESRTRIAGLRDALEEKIAAISPDSTFFSGRVARLPNTSNFTMPGVDGATQVMALDLEGIGVSSGAACASGKVANPRVQMAMGAGEDLAGSAIRVSLGPTTRQEDIDRLVAAWQRLWERTQSSRAATQKQ